MQDIHTRFFTKRSDYWQIRLGTLWITQHKNELTVWKGVHGKAKGFHALFTKLPKDGNTFRQDK